VPSRDLAPFLSVSGDVVRIAVKAVPGAAKTMISGVLGDELKVRIAAAPERGRANAELESFFAGILSLPGRNVKVTRGQTSRSKVLEVSGALPDGVSAAISARIP
jgi:uncharacterized protein